MTGKSLFYFVEAKFFYTPIEEQIQVHEKELFNDFFGSSRNTTEVLQGLSLISQPPSFGN